MKYKVYMGFDSREELAYDVARLSILKRSDHKEVRVIPLELKRLSSILTRPIENREGKLWCPISDAPMATEFAISRFCVPFLEHKGWVLFVDCDIILRGDIRELFSQANDDYAVMVVKHQQPDTGAVKMDGQVQTYYERKNWSSVVLWNCSHPSNKKLTAEFLNNWPGRDLHAFRWLEDKEIGDLSPEWNYLVGTHGPEARPDENQKLLHFTLGGPWLPNWAGGVADDLWLEERKSLAL